MGRMREWADGIGILSRQGRGRAGQGTEQKGGRERPIHVPSQVVLFPGPGAVPTHPCIPALAPGTYRTEKGTCSKYLQGRVLPHL